jgi:hypothetical protein
VVLTRLVGLAARLQMGARTHLVDFLCWQGSDEAKHDIDRFPRRIRAARFSALRQAERKESACVSLGHRIPQWRLRKIQLPVRPLSVYNDCVQTKLPAYRKNDSLGQ